MNFLEYIWIDKDGYPRSKMRVVHLKDDIHLWNLEKTLSLIPLWNFDGSSTGQNIGKDTEVVLKPVRLYRDPFCSDKSNSYLVLCELDLEYNSTSDILKNDPIEGFNTRKWASKIAQKYKDLDPWFGLEQEYALLDSKTNLPYNWKEANNSQTQGDFYCSVRYPQCQLNDMIREHLLLCDNAGIVINGFNAEVLPSQWEFQVGPTNLLKAADDLIMARYLLFRLSTKYQVTVSLHPKPMSGDWNGSGCHLNFSTNLMREPSKGIDFINKTVEHLAADHPNILKYYGKHNELRLTGEHETSNMKTFSHGIGTRHTSVRIPNQVASQGYGYIEDRRAASNIDPYLALGKLLETSQN